jgi:integrase
MARFTASGKFTGVKYETLDNGDRSYYIVYKVGGKSKTVHIGKRSEGISEEFCHQKRNDAINRAKFGDDAPIVKYKKKVIATLDELAMQYFDDKALHNRNNERCKKNYLKHFSPVLGSEDIGNITSDVIEKWQRDKAKEICDTTGRPYAPKTINNLINDLSAIINHAILKGKFKGDNPAKPVKRQKIQNERQRYLLPKEVERLLGEISKHKDGELLTLFVLLSLSTGGRVKTVCNIRVQDLDLINGIATLYDFKNGTPYSAFLTKTVVEHCKNWISSRGFKHSDYVVSPDGKRLFNESNLNDDVKYISNRLGLILNRLFNQGLDVGNSKERVVIHTLRHTFASQLAIAGTPIYTIQKLMNHKDISQTLRYAKLAPDTGKEAVLSMTNNLLGFGL